MVIDGKAVVSAIERVSTALLDNQEYLLALDQAVGDGDLGITLSKIAVALREYAAATPTDDLGKFLAGAGMAANRVGSSSMGTLLATALMRAGKEARGLGEVTLQQLAAMLTTADQGVIERGKAQMGDKTLVDVLHPAAEAFAAAVASGADITAAGLALLRAAVEGRDRVTPLQTRIGRASWLGERSIGQVDPGCAALVIIFQAIAAK